MVSLENTIISGFLAAVTDMNTSGNYNYNWLSVQQQDLSKVTFPHLNMYQLPNEATRDSASFPNMNAFRNKQTYELHCFNKLTPESDNSVFEIDNTLNYMLHDIKKLIGSNPIDDTVEAVDYIGSIQRTLNNGSDIILPKYLVVTIEVYYSQDRQNPNQIVGC